MTKEQIEASIARAEAIMKAMTVEELRVMEKDPELAFHAICATLATTTNMKE